MLPETIENECRRLNCIAEQWRRRAVPVLLEALSHSEEIVRVEASNLLARLGGAGVLQGCLRILRLPGLVEARWAAAYCVTWLFPGRSRDKFRATEVLLRVAVDPADAPKVRAQCCEALDYLHAFGDRRLRRRISKALLPLLNDPSPEVRFWAAFALGALRCRFSLPHLDRVAALDTEICPDWWTVAEEASDAAAIIRGEEPPDRVPLFHQRHRQTDSNSCDQT